MPSSTTTSSASFHHGLSHPLGCSRRRGPVRGESTADLDDGRSAGDPWDKYGECDEGIVGRGIAGEAELDMFS